MTDPGHCRSRERTIIVIRSLWISARGSEWHRTVSVRQCVRSTSGRLHLQVRSPWFLSSVASAARVYLPDLGYRVYRGLPVKRAHL